MAVPVREYRSWSFTDRQFLFAAAVSVLWHLFWFFAVTIVVTPAPLKKPAHTALVSLGPVLDDTLIRTLVESRPEYSKAFYRELSEFESATELPARTVERRESGDITSLPFSEKTAEHLRQLLSGDKASPDEFFQGGAGFSISDYFRLEGDMKASDVLSRPEPPPVNDVRPVLITFEVDSDGRVASTEIASSSGDEVLDRQWEDHLRQWLFAPSPVLGRTGPSKGQATFRRSTVS